MKRSIIFLRRVKRFFVTAFIGGILVLLPAAILVVVLNWIFKAIAKLIHPITNILVVDKDVNQLLVNFLAIVILILFSFLMGLFVRTRIGNSIVIFFENTVFAKVPFYTTIKETVQHLFGKKQPFSKIALVDIYGTDTRMTAFVTDEREDGTITVFVPTGPNPTSGNIFHLQPHQVEYVKIATEDAMRTIIACGAGSGIFFNQNLNNQKAS